MQASRLAEECLDVAAPSTHASAMAKSMAKSVTKAVAKSTSTRAQKQAQKQAHALAILDALVVAFPDAHCELDHRSPWELLVAVVLSAQATDVSVNKVTPALFARFPDVAAFAAAKAVDVEPFIKSIGLFRNKAKNIVTAAQQVMTLHNGVVPSDRADLEALAGVGKKSAAVLIANCFGVPAIAVDTHVGRVSRRLGLTKETDPDKVEIALTALWPRDRLLQAHHTLIFQGRRTCHARAPDCDACSVATLCAKVDVDAD